MIRVTKSEGYLVLVDYTLPAKKTLYSGLAYKSVYYIEKLVGGSHYRNYLEFMKSGGLISFLESFNLETQETQYIFGGNIGIINLKRNMNKTGKQI